MSYYDREPITHLDGTPIFKTAEDQEAEDLTAAVLEKHFDCELRCFGKLAPIDWYALRKGRLVGVLELKARQHEAATYATVFLNVRKWLALNLAAVGLGVPGLFVVRFTDQVRWICVNKVDAEKHKMGGTTHMVKSRSDQEPVIEVPVAEMHLLPIVEAKPEP